MLSLINIHWYSSVLLQSFCEKIFDKQPWEYVCKLLSTETRPYFIDPNHFLEPEFLPGLLEYIVGYIEA